MGHLPGVRQPRPSVGAAFYDALAALGLRVCFDREALQPGDDWHRPLPRWVQSSSIVVVLLSARSEEAHYQRSEVIAAIDQARRPATRLIPVRLSDDAFVPYGTEQSHAVDMFSAADAPALAARIAPLVPARSAAPSGVFCPRIPPVPRHFTGREELLASLRTDDAVVLTQTIQGLGGVGKTPSPRP